jgi:hypothetical protein
VRLGRSGIMFGSAVNTAAVTRARAAPDNSAISRAEPSESNESAEAVSLGGEYRAASSGLGEIDSARTI